MYQDVLIPTDGSDGTRRAIAHGLAIAERFDATVHALSVVPEGPFGTFESEEATAVADRAVERVADEASERGLDVVTAVDDGVPHETILEYVDDNGIDLVVMGTQGRTGLDRVLVGSVAERIVRMADVPVVTVRLADEVRIEDPAEAERIATAEAERSGHETVAVRGEPHRTSGSWIVPLEADGSDVRAHVDAVSGDARLANRESNPETED